MNPAKSPPQSSHAFPRIPDDPPPVQDESLRKRAEKRHAAGRSEMSGPEDILDARRLLQELEIHQIELEMQNRELVKARNEAEEAREIYRDLYDFAPVGYFTLSWEGTVLMANLTGAVLLGMERAHLTGCSFAQWIVAGKRAEFGGFLSRVLNGGGPESVELEIQEAGGKRFFADIEAHLGAGDRVCRMMVTDVTRRKAEQKAKRLLKISTRSNRKLQAEVQQWREMDATLKTAREELSESLEKSEGEQKKLLNLSQALLYAQEEERIRISRELQSRITRALVAIQHELELLTFPKS